MSPEVAEWANAVVGTGLAYTPGQWHAMTRTERIALTTEANRQHDGR